MILAIKRLLYEEGFTIPGARRHLTEQISGSSAPPSLVGADLRSMSAPAASSLPDLVQADPSPAVAAPFAADGARPPAADHAETLRAVRDELRAILTLLG